MKTPFYELAEKIGNDPRGYEYYHGIVENMDFIYWDYFFSIMQDYDAMLDPNHQITALLFADLLWQDEMKGGGK